jgi:membrane protein implicated in regulation of membrane protease activity
MYRARLPENPLLQFFALLVAAVVAIGAVFLGAILLSLFLGLAVIAGLVLYIRLWWLRRRAAKPDAAGRNRPGEFVEVEYTVVEERSVADEQSKGSED